VRRWRPDNDWLVPSAIAVVVAALNGCGVFSVTAPRPTPTLEPVAPVNAAELVVIVHGGLGLQGWTIAVDGVARAWIPGFAGYTRIPVMPGERTVHVTHRMREFAIVAVPSPPMMASRSADRHVDCPSIRRCALAVHAVIRQAQGLHGETYTLDISRVAPAAIDSETAGLPQIAPGS
jgi:hypothetical protein